MGAFLQGLEMSEFKYSDGVTDISWKHQAHENKWYVDRKPRHHDALAEQARKVRNAGGTKTIEDGRVIATIPEDLFYQANNGITYGGKYKGFMSADHESQEKLLSLFMQEPEIRIFMLNDNYRV